jgi:hypothetical protein
MASRCRTSRSAPPWRGPDPGLVAPFRLASTRVATWKTAPDPRDRVGQFPDQATPRIHEAARPARCSDDMLVETKLDRLGRILDRRPIDRQQAGGVGHRVHYLALGGVDLTSPAGKMTMGVIAAVAQFEKDF